MYEDSTEEEDSEEEKEEENKEAVNNLCNFPSSSKQSPMAKKGAAAKLKAPSPLRGTSTSFKSNESEKKAPEPIDYTYAAKNLIKNKPLLA